MSSVCGWNAGGASDARYYAGGERGDLHFRGPIGAAVRCALHLSPEDTLQMSWMSRNASFSEFRASGERLALSAFNATRISMRINADVLVADTGLASMVAFCDQAGTVRAGEELDLARLVPFLRGHSLTADRFRSNNFPAAIPI